KLGGDKFSRVKIGVGKPAFKSAVSDWVLGKFSEDELKELRETSLPAAKTRTLSILKSLHKH
ncbi:MAG: aminoacyl-tRNA hydrolase, partial [Silvanigrellaceae bacterium]|nr:aminoacyl-tRNA hydrolase [Silvanigrellaceae bacterium]